MAADQASRSGHKQQIIRLKLHSDSPTFFCGRVHFAKRGSIPRTRTVAARGAKENGQPLVADGRFDSPLNLTCLNRAVRLLSPDLLLRF
jgi:hypothetical protein